MLSQTWGPPTWRVLHGIAHRIAPDNIAAKHTFVRAVHLLPIVMPCSTCRKEFHTLLEKIASHDGSGSGSGSGFGADTWLAWDPARWMYELHAHVLKNITRRRVSAYLQAAGVVGGDDDPMVDVTTGAAIPVLTFETVQNRIIIANGAYFSRTDLWTMLALYAGAITALAANAPGGVPADPGVVSAVPAVPAADIQSRSAAMCEFGAAVAELVQDVPCVAKAAAAMKAALCRKPPKGTAMQKPKSPEALLRCLCSAFDCSVDDAQHMAMAALVKDHPEA